MSQSWAEVCRLRREWADEHWPSPTTPWRPFTVDQLIEGRDERLRDGAEYYYSRFWDSAELYRERFMPRPVLAYVRLEERRRVHGWVQLARIFKAGFAPIRELDQVQWMRLTRRRIGGALALARNPALTGHPRALVAIDRLREAQRFMDWAEI